MSYRLIDANEIAIKYPEVNEMDCIYVDLPNGLDNEYHYIDAEPTKHGEPIKMMCNGAYINCPAHKDYERGYKDGQAEAQMKAEPVKHGRWIWRGGNLYECSECGAIVVAQDYIPIELHKFCRGCGSKMYEVEDGL